MDKEALAFHLIMLGLTLGPGIIGIVSVVGAIALFRRAKTAPSSTVGNVMGGLLIAVGALCIVFALGIGSCYALVAFSMLSM